MKLISAGGERRVLPLLCPDDGEALYASSARLADADRVEVWDGDRLVCRLKGRPAAGKR